MGATTLIKDQGKITEADFMSAEPIKAPNIFTVEYNVDYIELKVYNPSKLIRNTYTIENANGEFRQWCIVNGHSKEEHEREYNADDRSDFSTSHDTTHCEEDADLLLAYCMEQIELDFPQPVKRLAPVNELSRIQLPHKINLVDYTTTKRLEKGESFMVTAHNLHEVGGEVFIVTEIGALKVSK
jgi:hypothetical protein